MVLAKLPTWASMKAVDLNIVGARGRSNHKRDHSTTAATRSRQRVISRENLQLRHATSINDEYLKITISRKLERDCECGERTIAVVENVRVGG